MSDFLGNAADYAAIFCYAAAILGCLYALLAVWLARAFVGRTPATAQIKPQHCYPPVTILKPLHGNEPGLFANLASFCVQDYPGPIQIVFGVQDSADPAIGVVRRLIADFPDLDLELVVSSRRHGANRKISNLLNMMSAVRHDVLVLSDSDIIVGRDYLKNITAALDQPGVGLVTCLYRGAAASSPWARLGAAAIDYHFLPSVLVGIKLGLAKPCFGSTIGITKNTLDLIGGFNAVAEHIADDYAIGELVRRAGLKVAIPSFTVTHVCTQKSGRDLFRNEMRWARTIRFVDAFGFIGSAITHALPLALLGTLLGGVTEASVIVIAALACRFSLQMQFERTFRLSGNLFWLGPLRDAFSFMVFCASFFGRTVEWRGLRYAVRTDNTLAYAEAIE